MRFIKCYLGIVFILLLDFIILSLSVIVLFYR